LAFTSDRNNRNTDVWFAWLNKKDWQKTKQDWDDIEEPKEKDKKKKGSKKVKDIKIDTKDIYKRLVQVTSKPGNEGNIAISKDGNTFYFTSGTPTEKGSDLFSIKWEGKDVKQITKGGKTPSSLVFDKDHKFLYMKLKGGKLARLKDGKDKTESLAFSAKMEINYKEEKEQIFEDAWGALNLGFYDPNFHGQDWNLLKAKYKPLVLAASTNDDFRYMFNNMLGELNASHMGLYGKGREETQKESTGLIGVEVAPLEEGVKVTHVVLDSPADKKSSKLNKNDIILSVNGKQINSRTNYYSLLSNTVDEQILLQVKNQKGKLREVIIRPTKSIRSNLYDEWVEQRRKLVDEYSKGKLGYLHIKAMGWESFERFEREMTAAGYGKEGIVIDVRYNGGGWTTDFLMTVLNYKQHAYTIPRGAAKDLAKDKKSFRQYYPLGERLPYSAWTKPSIALCNENSYSNAEIFSHAFKNLGIGSLVGIPTFGAVISTGAHSLIDGSRVRMPFRGWFVKADDSNMDFVPAVPDFILDNSPNSKSLGKDEQLKKAVDELLKQL
ncbi:MAG: PDZ domain-containing protein, partial [Ignavibacteriae bacterium]|nr:PDZ domain-containing protein [Ignavibacteriota bacterium]